MSHVSRVKRTVLFILPANSQTHTHRTVSLLAETSTTCKTQICTDIS